MNLFREEALDRPHLHGTISLALPLSWQVVSSTMFAILASIAVFLVTARYSRSETATGSLIPSGGLLQVLPPRVGRVGDVSVKEGQRVVRGQLLAKIFVGDTDVSGSSSQATLLEAISRQDDRLRDELRETSAAAGAERAEIIARTVGLAREIKSVEGQVSVQKRLIENAKNDFARVSSIADRGFVSRQDLSRREETILSREQQLATLIQTLEAKRSEKEQASRREFQTAARAAGAAARLQRDRAVVERDRLTARIGEAYALVAPANGVVSALDIHPGDTVDQQRPAMTIVPVGGRLVAQIQVPGGAIGFVRVGQTVRLALDAYPADRFGTIDAVITAVSAAPVQRAGPDGATKPSYLASASLVGPPMSANGTALAMLPGMTFTARIITGNRTLGEWLFDPLRTAAAR